MEGSVGIRPRRSSGGSRIPRDHTPDRRPTRPTDEMVRSPWRHGESGRNDLAVRCVQRAVTSENGPKVTFVAHASREARACIRLYAGKSEDLAVLAARRAAVKIQPVQTISREGRRVRSPEPSETVRRTSLEDEETVRTSWRHGEADRNDRPTPRRRRGNSDRAKFLVG